MCIGNEAMGENSDVDLVRMDSKRLSVKQRARLATEWATPTDVLSILASDADVTVRRRVATRDGLEDEAINALLASDDPTHETVANLLQSRDLPAGVVRQIYERTVVHGHFPARYDRTFSTYLFRMQENVTDEILAALIAAFPDDDDFACGAAVHKNASLLTYAAIVAHSSEEACTFFFEYAPAPWNVIVASAKTAEMRARLAVHPRNPQNTLELPKAYAVLLNTSRPSIEALDVAGEEIDPRAYSDDEQVRTEVSFTTTSWSTLRVLASDPSPQVRNAVSLNSHTPTDAIDAIASGPTSEDSELGVTEWMNVANAAIHPNTSPAVLTRLAREGDSQIRLNVASNNHSPIPILEYLRVDVTPEIREAASGTIARRSPQ